MTSSDMRDLAVALMRVWWVTTATSCRLISQTRLLSQRPRRRTNSASSNWCNKRVAPPGRREARSYGATSADLRVGRPSAACSIENLFLKVLDEKLKGSLLFNFPKAAVKRRTTSCGSIRAAWCLAATPRVFDWWIWSNANETPGAPSPGRAKSPLVAARASPILNKPHPWHKQEGWLSRPPPQHP